MSKKQISKSFLFFSFLLGSAFLFSSLSRADEPITVPPVVSSPAKTSSLSGTLNSVVNTYFIKGDRGRFRQDWNTDDRTTGGVDEVALNWESNGVDYEFEGRSIINYDYLSRIRASKEDEFYYDLEWKQFRKYWDGSQDKEVWNPDTYGLPAEFQDWDDEPLHTDRGNLTLEIGKRLTDQSKLILGYKLWTRHGRMPTLRGDVAGRTGFNNMRSINMRTRVDGVSNTFTLRIPVTFNQVHQVEPLLSFETYRDDQFTDSVRYNNGALNQKRDYQDAYTVNNLKFQVTYQGYPQEDVFLHSGYYFNFLENDSVRSETRPGQANPNTYVNPTVDAWRVSNVFSLGSTLMDFLKKQGLDLRLGFRGEHALTDTEGTLSQNGTTARNADSALNEGWFGEVLSLTYRGKKNDTVYLGVDLEQRRLSWEDTFDAGAHEISTTFNAPEALARYETNITYIDFTPRLKWTHRFNSRLKSFFQYRWKSRQRRYKIQEDTLGGFYPGILGDQFRNIHEITTKFDVKLTDSWTSTLKYQWVIDNLDYQKTGEGQQDLDRNRFSLAFSGPVGEKLFAYISGSYELYRLVTPTFGSGNNLWGLGEGAYDYNGDYFILATNLSRQLSEKVSSFLSYQLTNSMGDNSNVLNEVAVGLQWDINDTTSFETRYQVFNFRDNRGYDGTFDDDYYGHGMAFAFKHAFA